MWPCVSNSSYPHGFSTFVRLARDGLLAALLALLGLAGAQADGLSVSPSSLSVAVGSSALVRVSNVDGTVSVRNEHPEIASASYASGTLTIRGLLAGSTRVTVSDRESSRRVDVTVTRESTGLTVLPTSLTIAVNATGQAQVSGARDSVTVRSANREVATATFANNIVTVRGVSVGVTRISVSDGHSTRSIDVTVVNATPTLSVSPTSLSLAINTSAQIQVSGASGTVTVTSANPAIASVTFASNVATVRGLAVGTTSITVRDNVASRVVPVTVTGTIGGGGSSLYALLAWNDLGMHCIDGSDYSVFSLLPPYNNLHAQLVNTGGGGVVTTGVTLTYESVADAAGSINTISSTKTNFWQYVFSMFGTQPALNVGLDGNPTPSLTPAPMAFNATQGWFEATAIPITAFDDTMQRKFYPMVKVVAKDGLGNVLATTRAVLPVSDEMTCKNCHTSIASGNSAQMAAQPSAGWVFDAAPERDWKRNILRLHDELQLGTSVYTSAAATLQYNPAGLSATADGGRPILCAACHSSNALPGFGVSGVLPLTSVLHTRHATVRDPATGLQLDADGTRSACYQCHPGSVTQCLRGAMSNVVDATGGVAISCQSCHGKMAAVGAPTRVGWLQEPNCQSCHHDGVRETNALDASGALRVVTDQRFATNPNQPAAGFSLFRFSKGHGTLQCEACHGSTHAEYPSVEPNDNVQNIALQGYAGTLTECKSCHTSVPLTTSGGPHGMHTIGDAWVSAHGDVAEGSSARQSCAYCHGADFRGSPLSEIKVAKTFRVEGGTRSFPARHQMNCFDCHNGPSGD